LRKRHLMIHGQELELCRSDLLNIVGIGNAEALDEILSSLFRASW
jgi:hypothetical protein